MVINPGSAAPLGSGHPVSLRVIDEREMNRLWGIPIVGIAVRAFLAIPHALVLMIMSIGMNAWIFLGWIPILLNGRAPAVRRQVLDRSTSTVTPESQATSPA